MHNKIVIFDGNALMHRAFHAIPPLTTPNGEPINAVYGVFQMLFKVINDLNPTHIIFAFDTPEPTFRKKLLEDYQAQRARMDESLSSQFEKVYDALSSMGILILKKSGFEADDVIGTLASKLKEKNEIIIVTGDRDILQLVDKNVSLLMPGRGLSDSKIYNKDETIERMGVLPSQIIDLKALVGDPSDNYKGIKGIGPKTAVNLIEKYHNLDNIYKNLDDLSDRYKNLLIENRESAYLSQKLATIVCDVSIDFNLKNAEVKNLANDEVLSFFDLFGFKGLKKRLLDLSKKYVSKNQLTLL